MKSFRPKLFTLLKDYSFNQFTKDVTAGVIVAIIALPLSIALAIASGVSPEKGLHTAIIAGFLISFFGGSRVQIGGPTGAFMVIVYGIVMKFGIDGLILATFMAGIMMILLGLLRLGNMIKFIPYPITTGFTSGIAITIFSSQVKDFLGLKTPDLPAEFLDKWEILISSIDTIDYTTTLIGLIALSIIVFWPKINRKIPGALVALLVTSLIVHFLKLDIPTIGSKFGELSSSLPSFSLPTITKDRVLLLLGPAFTIAMLGSIESLLSAVVADGMIGAKHRSNTELIAQGIANIGSSLFGGIPATGAIARTVANIKNGGRTPIAGIVHSITLLLIMLLFMPLAKVIPLTSLSAVLIVVAYNMSDWREFKELLKSPKSDILVLIVTFSVTVLIDLVKAIEIGLILSSFLFMKRMADVSSVNLANMDASEEYEGSNYKFDNDKFDITSGIQIYEINGPFFFGAADKFIEATGNFAEKTEILIIRMRNVPSMDATAVHAFKRLIKTCESKKIKLLVSEVQSQPKSVLDKSNLLTLIGKENFFDDINKSINYANSL